MNRKVFLQDIGIKVREARKAAGFSQVVLAETLGIKAETIGNIERGYTAPRITTLKTIADAIGVDLKEFL